MVLFTLSQRCCCWVLWHFLTSKVISVASDIEREKSDKICPEALISASCYFTCRKSTTRTHGFTSFRGKSYFGFLRSGKSHRPRPGSNPRTSNPEASMITTGPPGTTYRKEPISYYQAFSHLRETNMGSGIICNWVWTRLPSVSVDLDIPFLCYKMLLYFSNGKSSSTFAEREMAWLTSDSVLQNILWTYNQDK